MTGIAILAHGFLGQGLNEPNPASRLVWWVGGVAFLVVAILYLVEIVDWFRWRGFRRDGAGQVEPGWRLHEPDSALRRRFFGRVRPRRRLWPWGDRLSRESPPEGDPPAL